MNDRSDRTLARLGATSGIAAVILLLAIIALTPAIPPPNHSLGDITRSTTEDADAILRGAYLGMLFSGLLLLFGASIAAWLAVTAETSWRTSTRPSTCSPFGQ